MIHILFTASPDNVLSVMNVMDFNGLVAWEKNSMWFEQSIS